MDDLPKVGSLWKYTGMNPAIRWEHGTGHGTEGRRFLNPTVVIDHYNDSGSVVYLKVLDGRESGNLMYSVFSFLKHFIPHNSHASEQLMPFQALVGQALFNGVPKEDIHELLVALEI